ncbi:MAG TPA: beta-propeller fold lactonase family protein [Terriglobales bacterium]|nr:beta-propeller fold lactonase family protein [Terriglobales bacterium]
MGMKFWFMAFLVLPIALFCLAGCASNSNSATTGISYLYVTAQANTSISAYTVTQSTGALTTVGSVLATGSVATALAVTPTGSALFVANSGSNNISTYSINADGSLTAVSGTTSTGSTPVALAVDQSGKFLFVANLASSDISVFSINGTVLTPAPGSPFTTVPVGLSYPNGTLPAAVAVSASGKFLYVANRLANFVSAFAINSTSGALTPLGVPFYDDGQTSPSGLAVTPNGGFLYVANAGANSNNISAYAICDKVVNSCTNPNTPDGTLTQVTGSPFPAGLGPVAIAFDPGFSFAYVVDKGSNTISQYSYGPESGVLTPLSPGTISTGTTPVSIAILPGVVVADIGNTLFNTTDYAYVANLGSGTVSIFSLTTSTGLLNVVGQPIVIFGQTSAVLGR